MLTTNVVPVITVDGPGGSGKGTISRLLAQKLGWHLLDSGVLYRLTAMAALRKGIKLDRESELAVLARDLDVLFTVDQEGEPRILLNGENVTLDVRSEACGESASKVAALQSVRDALLQRQRDFRTLPGLVADGRDMGTAIFPDAPLKIFLTASLQERALRRQEQLKTQGVNANLSSLLRDLSERDARDARRAVSPLRPANDAVEIDSSELDIPAVLDRILKLAIERNIV